MPWEDQIFPEKTRARASGFHVALGTRRSAQEILERAGALGWRALECERAGVFGVIEVWVDDRHLVEVLIPKEAERYRSFMHPEGCRAMFGPGAPPSSRPTT